jgi:hypothetical protein
MARQTSDVEITIANDSEVVDQTASGTITDVTPRLLTRLEATSARLLAKDWDRAGLECMHHHLAAVITSTSQWLSLTGQALVAHAEGHYGTVEDLLAAMEPHVEELNRHMGEPEELYYELLDPSEPTCATCGQTVGQYHGTEGWQHSRQTETAGIPGTHAELYVAEHPTEPIAWRPRQRPTIRNCRIVDSIRDDEPARPD